MSVHRVCNNCLRIIKHDTVRYIVSQYTGTMPDSKLDFCSPSCLRFGILNPEVISQLKEVKEKFLVTLRQ